jgi:hypothetical protein
MLCVWEINKSIITKRIEYLCHSVLVPFNNNNANKTSFRHSRAVTKCLKVTQEVVSSNLIDGGSFLS